MRAKEDLTRSWFKEIILTKCTDLNRLPQPPEKNYQFLDHKLVTFNQEFKLVPS